MAGKRPTKSSKKRLFEDLFTNDLTTHSIAANTVLATAEVQEALARNGVDPMELRNELFDVLLDFAEPFPTLTTLIEDWLDEGDENPGRLEELHDYNELVRKGEFKEKRDDG